MAFPFLPKDSNPSGKKTYFAIGLSRDPQDNQDLIRSPSSPISFNNEVEVKDHPIAPYLRPIVRDRLRAQVQGILDMVYIHPRYLQYP